MESFPTPQNNNESQENLPVTKEQVLNAFASHDKEHEPSKELLIKWIDQRYAEIREITDLQEQSIVQMEFEIEKAELYFDTGFWEIALEELEGDGVQQGIIDATYLSDELAEKAYLLIEKIKAHQASNQSMLGGESITVSGLESLSNEELQKRLDEAVAPDTENFEYAVQLRNEIAKRG
ncbi:MAG: hypothetical protein JWL92_505 [Candidatus Nomurabacteria bacterium]|nr:hypothetical protein [Candidatus Nomurabacteria bacterium]